MIVDSFLCQHDEKISGIVWTYIARVYILRGLLAACIKQLRNAGYLTVSVSISTRYSPLVEELPSFQKFQGRSVRF